ncbi:hypothetical protein Tco_1231723, partial [Tanacetum coccineum]
RNKSLGVVGLPTWQSYSWESLVEEGGELVHAGSSLRSTRQKTSPAKVKSLAFLTIFNDEEGLPDVSKLPNDTACHMMISNITPPAWGAVVDNVMNRRARELLKVVDQMKGECDVLKERENLWRRIVKS